jgi:Reprolysin family propeptide
MTRVCFQFKSSDFSLRSVCVFQYEFDAFGRHFHLLLKHDPAASSATQTLRAHHVFSNHSHVQPVHQDASRCFYSGTVRGDDKSKVNLNLCHGMVSTKRHSFCLF